MFSHKHIALIAFSLCAACGSAQSAGDNFEGPPPAAAMQAYAVSEAAYCRVISQPGLTFWDRDVLTLCASQTDLGEPPDCTVKVIQGDSLRTVDVGSGVFQALRASGNRMVLLRGNGELVLREASGATRRIAAYARTPHVSADGARVSYVTVPEGVEVGFDNPYHPEARLVVTSLSDLSTEIITQDADAYSPMPVPDSDEYLWISNRNDVEAFWNGTLEWDSQTTNVGLRTGDQGVVPVGSRGSVWLPASQSLVFETGGENSRLYLLDLAHGNAVQELGPGSWPALAEDGSVLAAREQSSAADCAIRYMDNDEP